MPACGRIPLVLDVGTIPFGEFRPATSAMVMVPIRTRAFPPAPRECSALEALASRDAPLLIVIHDAMISLGDGQANCQIARICDVRRAAESATGQGMALPHNIWTQELVSWLRSPLKNSAGPWGRLAVTAPLKTRVHRRRPLPVGRGSVLGMRDVRKRRRFILIG